MTLSGPLLVAGQAAVVGAVLGAPVAFGVAIALELYHTRKFRDLTVVNLPLKEQHA